MNSIDRRIAIRGMAADFGARSPSRTGKLPATGTTAQSGTVHVPQRPIQKDVSFSTYGSNNEHIAITISNRETGKVVCEVPSKELQKLHVHLEVMV